MTGAEIRDEAKMRRKRGMGLVPIAFAEVGFLILMSFAEQMALALGHWGGVAVSALFLVAYGLIFGAGRARASCAAWKTGRARFADLFAPVTNARRFARAMTTVLLAVALTLLQQCAADFVSESAHSSTAVAWGLVALVLAAAASIVKNLYYALALWSDASLVVVLLSGFALALWAFWRFFGMTMTILVFPLVGVATLGTGLREVAQSAAPSLAALIALGVALAGCVAFIAWRTLPYYYMACAGLAEDVFCPPEDPARE